MSRPLKVFFSYSHEDNKLRARLDKALATLKNMEKIEGWYDGAISPGAAWEKTISDNLNNADIILLLITDNFLSSRACYQVEVTAALEREKQGKARVIPIVLQNCDWMDGTLNVRQALPKDGKAVDLWRPKTSGWKSISEGIRRVVNELAPDPPKAH